MQQHTQSIADDLTLSMDGKSVIVTHCSWVTSPSFAGPRKPGPGGTQHDDAAVVEQELCVPDDPVAVLMARPLRESDDRRLGERLPDLVRHPT